MKRDLLLIATVIIAGIFATAVGILAKEISMSEGTADVILGKTIRWTFSDGPMAEVPVEHTFDEDGSVTWRIVGGSMKGASAREKKYAAVKISEDVYAVSYLAASGHTLTVVLNFNDRRMTGFGSNEKSWTAMKGTFEVVK